MYAAGTARRRLGYKRFRRILARAPMCVCVFFSVGFPPPSLAHQPRRHTAGCFFFKFFFY